MTMGVTRMKACNDLMQAYRRVLMTTGLTKSYYGNKNRGVRLSGLSYARNFRSAYTNLPRGYKKITCCVFGLSQYFLYVTLVPSHLHLKDRQSLRQWPDSYGCLCHICCSVIAGHSGTT